MVDRKKGDPLDCPKCHKGYKYGFFIRCPHCNVLTGESFEPAEPVVLPKKKRARRR